MIRPEVHELHLEPPALPTAPSTRATLGADAEEPVSCGFGAPDADVVASLYERGPAALIGHALGGLALIAFYAPHAPRRLLTFWLVAFLLGWVARAGVVLVYRRSLPLAPSEVLRAHRAWELSTVLSGGLWGLAVAMFFPYGSDIHRMGLVLAVFGYSLAAPATSYAVFLLYTAACFLPLVVHLASGDQPYSLALAGGMTLVFLTLLVVARQDQRMFQRLTDLKRRDAQLVRQLEDERNAAHLAQERAQAATLAKSRFFSAASHDLRQPLHAMALFTRSLLHHRLEPPSRRLVTSIDEALFAMERLFDQILDLDRLDSGGLVARPQAVAMQTVFDRVRVHVEAPAFDKGLALGFRGGHHPALADPLLLERVLRNLVANAIRYTEDGGILVAARPRGGRLALQIWDTGVGIPAQALPRVFDEFYQFEADRRPETGEYRGLGLGLAIVRRLVGLMQVPLTVQTRPGHGTVFTLLLPVPSAAEVPAREPQATGPVRPSLQGRRVLLVESGGPETARLIEWLRSWSAQVRVCRADALGVERVWSGGMPPDLLVVEASEGTGTLVGAVGRIEAFRRALGAPVPVIVLCDPEDPGDTEVRVDLPAGVQRLERPVRPNRLRALVAYQLAPGTGRAAADSR